MVNLLYLTIPLCRGAELSGLWGVARRRSVRLEGLGQRRARPLFRGVCTEAQKREALETSEKKGLTA